MSAIPAQIDQISVKLKANVYFDGKVVSHTLLFPDGKMKTVGIIYPGSFTFNTDAPERMDLIAGSCRVTLKGETAYKTYSAGQTFDVPGKSSFEIVVDSGITEYLCSFE